MTRNRRLWAAGSVTALVAGMAFTGATPASAVAYGCDILDGGSSSGATAFSIDTNYAYHAGDVITVTWSDLTDSGATVTLAVPSGGSAVDSRTGAGAVSYTFSVESTTTWSSGLSIGSGSYSISCASASPNSGAGNASSAIPAWVQAYARSDKDAPCEDGWNTSWQAWAEPVTGGWVCTRSIPSLG